MYKEQWEMLLCAIISFVYEGREWDYFTLISFAVSQAVYCKMIFTKQQLHFTATAATLLHTLYTYTFYILLHFYIQQLHFYIAATLTATAATLLHTHSLSLFCVHYYQCYVCIESLFKQNLTLMSHFSFKSSFNVILLFS